MRDITQSVKQPPLIPCGSGHLSIHRIVRGFKATIRVHYAELPFQTTRSNCCATAFRQFRAGTEHDGVRYSWTGTDTYGTMVNLETGAEYEGGYGETKRHGEGRQTYAARDGVPAAVFEGTYVNNQMNGQGTLTMENGNVFKGQYRNSKINGHGVFTFADGNYWSGFWQDGKPKQGIWTLLGKVEVFADGPSAQEQLQSEVPRRIYGTCGQMSWSSINNSNTSDAAHCKRLWHFRPRERYWTTRRTSEVTLHSSGGKFYTGQWLDGKQQAMVV